MDDTKFWRLRALILVCTTFPDNGIHYNSNSALQKGYSKEETAIADELLTNCSFFTSDFLDKIRYLRGEMCQPKPGRHNSEYKPRIYFVEFAKIIFILDKDTQKSRHIFEEDLEKGVICKQFITICQEHIEQHFNHVSCGDPQKKQP